MRDHRSRRVSCPHPPLVRFWKLVFFFFEIVYRSPRARHTATHGHGRVDARRSPPRRERLCSVVAFDRIARPARARPPAARDGEGRNGRNRIRVRSNRIALF
eukprot:31134-Pelagococcus_subviridis.AAC.6